MDISRLDAWYSSKDGSIEGPATYIVRGLCRRCCLPEVILWCMQVSLSLRIISYSVCLLNYVILIQWIPCTIFVRVGFSFKFPCTSNF